MKINYDLKVGFTAALIGFAAAILITSMGCEYYSENPVLAGQPSQSTPTDPATCPGELVNGLCTITVEPPAPAPIVCGEGTTFENGVCISATTPNPIVCGEGTVEADGVCVPVVTEDDSSEEDPEETGDGTPPTVRKVDHLAVGTASAVRVTFREDVELGSVVLSLNPSRTPDQKTNALNRSVVAFIFNAGLPCGHYTGTVSGAKDLSGESMATPYDFEFDVACSADEPDDEEETACNPTLQVISHDPESTNLEDSNQRFVRIIFNGEIESALPEALTLSPADVEIDRVRIEYDMSERRTVVNFWFKDGTSLRSGVRYYTARVRKQFVRGVGGSCLAADYTWIFGTR